LTFAIPFREQGAIVPVTCKLANGEDEGAIMKDRTIQ